MLRYDRHNLFTKYLKIEVQKYEDWTANEIVPSKLSVNVIQNAALPCFLRVSMFKSNKPTFQNIKRTLFQRR